jgi:hypothetical protein
MMPLSLALELQQELILLEEILEISITVQHLSLMEKATKLLLLFNLSV